MTNFVPIALRVCEEMCDHSKEFTGIVMRFAKKYPPEKMGTITRKAKEYSWWEQNPKAAFMKALGEINKAEEV